MKTFQSKTNMQTPIREYFRFQKVEDYFRDTSGWDCITQMTAGVLCLKRR